MLFHQKPPGISPFSSLNGISPLNAISQWLLFSLSLHFPLTVTSTLECFLSVFHLFIGIPTAQLNEYVFGLMNPDPENQGGTPRMYTKVHIPQHLVRLLFHKSILGYLICDAFGKDTLDCLFYGISWEIRMMFIVIQQLFFWPGTNTFRRKK